MIFLIGLVLAAVFAAVCDKALKKHAEIFYIGSVIIAAAVIICTFANVTVSFPAWFSTWIWPLFARSGFATSLFVIVMLIGALPNGSAPMRKLMPIRGELSIIASILTLGHNISYGRTYFMALFGGRTALQAYLIAASVTSLIMIVIMVPLMITSFRAVRKKMKAKSWKRLQRSAYVFYALIYVHVMILSVPMLKAGRGEYLFNIILYSAVFFAYAAMRVGKALSKKIPSLRRVPAAACLCLFVAVCAVGCSQADSDKGEPVSSLSVEAEQNEETLSADEDGQEGEADENADAEHQDDENGGSDNASNSGSQSDDSGDKAVRGGNSTKSGSGNGGTSSNTASQNAGSSGSASKSSAGETSKPASSGTKNMSGSQSAQTSKPAQTTQPAQPAAPTYKYKNGTFTGTAQGFNGPITVSVTIQNDVIKSVSVISASDDEPYLSNAKALTSKIVSSQSTGVSVVSGATYSSTGIINAAKAAMNSAKN